MPVYNAVETIDRAIESILNQDYGHFELVIVDDGSTDGSLVKMQNWSQQDARIAVSQQPHKGIVHALNEGLRRARGRYIARMDADDISSPQRLTKQLDYLQRNPGVGVVSCRVDFLGDADRQSGYARYVQWVNSLSDEDDISLRRFIESPVPHPSVMFRRWIVDSLGGYRDGAFPEDYELWLRWMHNGIRFHKLPARLLKWRDHPNRLSRTHPRYRRMAFHRIKAYYLSEWLKMYNPQHPRVIIWGSSRNNRKRAHLLDQYGIEIIAYVDINPNKIGQEIHGIPVWSPEELPSAGTCFVISFVSSRGANRDIAQHLRDKGYVEGLNFLFGA